jgi:hypothetical protein
MVLPGVITLTISKLWRLGPAMRLFSSSGLPKSYPYVSANILWNSRSQLPSGAVSTIRIFLASCASSRPRVTLPPLTSRTDTLAEVSGIVAYLQHPCSHMNDSRYHNDFYDFYCADAPHVAPIPPSWVSRAPFIRTAVDCGPSLLLSDSTIYVSYTNLYPTI